MLYLTCPLDVILCLKHTLHITFFKTSLKSFETLWLVINGLNMVSTCNKECKYCNFASQLLAVISKENPKFYMLLR